MQTALERRSANPEVKFDANPEASEVFIKHAAGSKDGPKTITCRKKNAAS